MNNKKPPYLFAAAFLFFIVAWYGISRWRSQPPVSKEPQAVKGQTRILLDQNGSTVQGNGVLAEDGKVGIVRGGSYLISGTLEDGQLYIDAGDDDTVELVFAGTDISNGSEAAVYVEHAKQAVIVLAEGTENRLQSGRTEEITGADADAKGGALYARTDLTIKGSGVLQVFGYVNNGIHSTDRLSVEGGELWVEAQNNGLKGKDEVGISGGHIRITAGRKGVCADKELHISDGEILVARSNEGFEANQITIDGGMMDITSEDDGINACGGPDSDGKPEKMPNLRISGGTITINAEGDGLDSNGNLFVEGGMTVINGPSTDDDGALDYGSENRGICEIHGGTVLAIGSAGMAVTFEESSGQCSLRWILEAPYEAGDEIVISDETGAVLYRHEAVKSGASVIFSSPGLVRGETYTLQAGGKTAHIMLDSISTDLGSPIPEPKKPKK